MGNEEVRERLATACLELLEIESTTGNEKAIADALERWAMSQPALNRDDVVRHGNGLVIGSAGDAKPSIALVGHLDTVPPPDGYSGPRREGERVIGLGAADMKGSIAVMQTLFERLPLDDLPFSLLLVLYDREEGPYADNGLEALLDSYESLKGADLAIAMEPTDNTLQLGCLGSIHARATFRGRAAHSARPWQGDNAIHKAAALLTTLRDRAPRDVVIEGMTFRETISCTIANGGRARNVIPDRFEINLNHRFAPTVPTSAAIERAIAEIKTLCANAEVEIKDVAPPAPPPVDNPILEHIRAQADLAVAPKQAWTDVARLASHGIEAINFGPGSTAQAHQTNESIGIDEMVRSYDVLARVLQAPLLGM